MKKNKALTELAEKWKLLLSFFSFHKFRPEREASRNTVDTIVFFYWRQMYYALYMTLYLLRYVQEEGYSFFLLFFLTSFFKKSQVKLSIQLITSTNNDFTWKNSQRGCFPFQSLSSKSSNIEEGYLKTYTLGKAKWIIEKGQVYKANG